MCFILNQKDQCIKFEEKVDKGFFLGYLNESKAYSVFDINSQIIEESIHVIFNIESYVKDQIDHHASIVDELTHHLSEDYEVFQHVISFEADHLSPPSPSLKDND